MIDPFQTVCNGLNRVPAMVPSTRFGVVAMGHTAAMNYLQTGAVSGGRCPPSDADGGEEDRVERKGEHGSTYQTGSLICRS